MVVLKDLVPGLQAGRYTLVGRLGIGSMGEVWRAAGPAGEVALKIPRRPAFLRHLRREGVLLEKIDHPRVARLLEVELEGEVPHLAMEYVRGSPLRTLCRGTITVREATVLSDQILDGLAAIHDAGIVHLDLKPENVLVTPNGSVKIVDLGLGQAMSALMAELYLSASLASRDIPLAGTLAYMAPERRKGKAVDRRADLYAFGVLLHELLSGKLPEPGTRLSRVRPGLEPRWDVAVAALTHPEPSQRPASAEEARRLIAMTLAEKPAVPVVTGGITPRDVKTFDDEALAFESPWQKGMVVGDCELEEQLGRGGYGEVWKARRGEERVAVKLALRDEARAVLGVEAELAARVKHPGVPRVLADRSQDEPPHVVFELVPGRSLRARIHDDGKIPVAEGLAVFEAMARVVAACHEAGVVHRDLKPEHFLVGERVSLIDFGLAQLAGMPAFQGSLATGAAAGTYDYMPPEQGAGESPDTASDVYALGVCLFEILADDLPRGPQRLATLRPEVPGPIDGLVLRMMATKPHERPRLGEVITIVGEARRLTPSVRARAARSSFFTEAMLRVLLARPEAIVLLLAGFLVGAFVLVKLLG